MSSESFPVEHGENRPWRLARASLFGVGIALAGLLPPIVHFCTGPLGPLVGGFIAGSWARARRGEGILIGLGMGVLMAVPAATLHATAAGNLWPLPGDLRDNLDFFTLLLVPYVAVLGTFGAVMGGNRAHSRQLADQPAGYPQTEPPEFDEDAEPPRG